MGLHGKLSFLPPTQEMQNMFYTTFLLGTKAVNRPRIPLLRAFEDWDLLIPGLMQHSRIVKTLRSCGTQIESLQQSKFQLS